MDIHYALGVCVPPPFAPLPVEARTTVTVPLSVPHRQVITRGDNSVLCFAFPRGIPERCYAYDVVRYAYDGETASDWSIYRSAAATVNESENGATATDASART